MWMNLKNIMLSWKTRYENIHTVWFHLQEILEQIKSRGILIQWECTMCHKCYKVLFFYIVLEGGSTAMLENWNSSPAAPRDPAWICGLAALACCSSPPSLPQQRLSWKRVCFKCFRDPHICLSLPRLWARPWEYIFTEVNFCKIYKK